MDWQQKAFDQVFQKWILKVLNILKISPVIITFLKYNIERWNTSLRLIHEKGRVKTNNPNINNGIFQGDLLSLLFCIALIPLYIELKNKDNGYKTTTEKINHLFCMNDSKSYAKIDDDLEGLLSTVKRFREDKGMQFDLENVQKPHLRKADLESPETSH